ncbi:MAG: HAMP domain-containing sensor histidine kinase [Nocardioides sp.]
MASISEIAVSSRRGPALVWHEHGVDILWWLFVAVNTWAIVVLRSWATVPFHFIWIGVTLMYGWRVWSTKVTALSLLVIVVVTGVTMLDDVVHGYQEPDELTEIPLMATVFVVMVVYVRRRVTAQRETEQIAAHNLALVEQSRTLVQNASHVLRTPLTIALGHAELVQKAATTSDLTEDAEVVVNELTRLKQITDRFLRLAKSEQPDFLYPVETAVGELVTTTVTRWMATHPLVGLGVVESEVMSLDPSRVAEALDELIGNAIVHCPGARIEVSGSRRADCYVISVADRGPGIPPGMSSSVFDRFSHGTAAKPSGAGLGLAIVKAVSEGHGGTVSLRSRRGGGSVFEMALPFVPLEPEPLDTTHPLSGVTSTA